MKADRGLLDCFPHTTHLSRSWGASTLGGWFAALWASSPAWRANIALGQTGQAKRFSGTLKDDSI